MNIQPEPNKNTTSTNTKKEKIRARNLKQRYNLSLEDYEKLLDSQNGQCKICGVTKCTVYDYLSVDHCHDTNNIRGLLCNSCNTGLGLLNDDTKTVKKALKYLRRSNETFINRYRNKLKARYDMVLRFTGYRDRRSKDTYKA